MARGRKPTYPTEIPDLINISIARFSKKGFLKPNQRTDGEITYQKFKIKFTIKIEENRGVLVLYFGSHHQVVSIISRPSNLGAGLVWFFKCSVTGFCGRFLYFYNGKFIGRKGIPYNYPAQNLGKNWRFIRQLFRREQELDIPEFKREYYAGKPTKNYLRFLKAVEKIEISEEEMTKFRNIIKF